MPRQSLNKRVAMTAATTNTARTTSTEALNNAAQLYQESMQAIRDNPRLKAKYDLLSEMADTSRTGAIRTHYNIGEIVKDIKDHPEIYGQDGIRHFRIVFGPRMVNQDCRFVEEFTSEEMDNICAIRNQSTGFTLTYEHVRLLLASNLETKQQQIGYLNRAVKNNWDAKMMYKKIKEERESTNTQSHGRTHAVPRTKSELVNQMIRIFHGINAKDEGVWNNPKDPAMIVFLSDFSDVDEDMLSAICNLSAELHITQEVVRRLTTDVDDIAVKYQRHLMNSGNPEMTVHTPIDVPTAVNMEKKDEDNEGDISVAHIVDISDQALENMFDAADTEA